MLAERIMKEGAQVINEDDATKKSMKDKLLEIVKEITEIPESRREMVADVLAEFDIPKDKLEKLVSKFMGLLTKKEFADKVAEISKVFDNIKPEQQKELEELRTKYSAFIANPNVGTKSAIKSGIIKAFANMEDADLKKLVDAERALIKAVESCC